MAESKADLWWELKHAGITGEKKFVEYTQAELQQIVDMIRAEPGYVAPPPRPQSGKKMGRPRKVKPVEPQLSERQVTMNYDQPQTEPEQDQLQYDNYFARLPGSENVPVEPRVQAPSVQETPRDRYAAERAYQPNEGETPIRTDEAGRVWFREEVRKPATPQPRARRRITYIDTGVKKETVVDGRFIETVEVAGDRRTTEMVKITMPSYQVGVYSDPRFPFKVHTYNNNRGFDLFDVQAFYGGADLVPSDILRVYVGNDLCYDIRSTIRSIQSEYRAQQLRGAIK